jgi:hypothetical protein
LLLLLLLLLLFGNSLSNSDFSVSGHCPFNRVDIDNSSNAVVVSLKKKSDKKSTGSLTANDDTSSALKSTTMSPPQSSSLKSTTISPPQSKSKESNEGVNSDTGQSLKRPLRNSEQLLQRKSRKIQSVSLHSLPEVYVIENNHINLVNNGNNQSTGVSERKNDKTENLSRFLLTFCDSC